MAGKQEFRGKLYEILEAAQEKNHKITVEEVEKFFEEEQLSEEQIGLVCEYLLSQKVSVSGYAQKAGTIKEQTEEPKKLSTEEQTYLEGYLRGLDNMQAENEKGAQMAYYLPKVAKEAVKLHHASIFLGDMIQEGNMSLVMALAKKKEPSEEEVMKEVRAGMLALAESQDETNRRDRKMVERVAKLNEVIKNMTEELGRKVTVDEVAERLGVTEAEIADVLKLVGEEVKEEEDS